MTTGHRSSVEPVTPKMRELLTPDILATIGKAVKAAKVDRAFEVPGVANRSKDGSTVYIDKDIPNPMKDGSGKPFDPAETLPWHEIPEWVLMNEGVPFEAAHSLATEEFEKPKVKELGLDWDKYQEAFGGEIDANEKRGVTDPPPDLDLRPYAQSGDEKHLHEIENDDKATPKGFRLVPVDHDPFAEAAQSKP